MSWVRRQGEKVCHDVGEDFSMPGACGYKEADLSTIFLLYFPMTHRLRQIEASRVTETRL